MKRRNFLKATIAGAGVVMAGWLPRTGQAAEPAFRHGVASGDPAADRLVIWTRVSDAGKPLSVRWKVATDAGMRDVVRKGRFRTGADRDYTVKVDVDGLPAGTTLYYQFTARGVASPVGRGKTLPVGETASATLAVMSCSNYASGYFHAYRDVARDSDIDAVLHLGDYIYEHGMGGYATGFAEALGRVPEPPHEIVSLDDYRARYAQYRTDPDLQAMHANHACIAVWDDHEFTNDAWRDGAQNHQPDEGGWPERRDTAIQAWLEWMPVRAEHAGAKTRIFRSFSFGKLLTLCMLDTRLFGRDRQADAGQPDREAIVAALKDPQRELLGEEQTAWLATELDADTRWQALGQQVMLMPNVSPDLEEALDLDKPAMVDRDYLAKIVAASKGNPPMILDTWNGYPAARERLLGLLKAKAANPVVLSGDLHTAMAGSVYSLQDDAPVTVEIMAPAISSPGFSEYLPERYPGAVADAAMAVNPHIEFMNTEKKGWVKVVFDADACTAEWRYVGDVHKRAFSAVTARRLRVEAGAVDKGLHEA